MPGFSLKSHLKGRSEAMTLRATFVALLLLIPAGAQAQPPGLAAIKASNAFIDCLVRATRRLDDGHSAAAAVARTTQAACVTEQHRWEDTQTAKLSDEKKRDFLEGIRAHTAA